MWSSDDIYFMNLALDEGERANIHNEVPIGAVLVMDDRVIATGYNCPITSNDPTAHAEIVALRSAGTWLRNYRLPNSTIYVTLEPCLMCFGALIQARVARVVFGAADLKIKTSSWINKFSNCNHRLKCEGGLLEAECRKQLQDFFYIKRQSKLAN